MSRYAELLWANLIVFSWKKKWTKINKYRWKSAKDFLGRSWTCNEILWLSPVNLLLLHNGADVSSGFHEKNKKITQWHFIFLIQNYRQISTFFANIPSFTPKIQGYSSGKGQNFTEVWAISVSSVFTWKFQTFLKNEVYSKNLTLVLFFLPS